MRWPGFRRVARTDRMLVEPVCGGGEADRISVATAGIDHGAEGSRAGNERRQVVRIVGHDSQDRVVGGSPSGETLERPGHPLTGALQGHVGLAAGEERLVDVDAMKPPRCGLGEHREDGSTQRQRNERRGVRELEGQTEHPHLPGLHRPRRCVHANDDGARCVRAGVDTCGQRPNELLGLLRPEGREDDWLACVGGRLKRGAAHDDGAQSGKRLGET